jgi:very-short-patch-repair endonuclease
MERSYVQWTDEALRERALRHNTRGDFQKYDKAAYLASKRKGKVFLDHVCSHMERPKISSPEKIIIAEVQKYFPNAKKFLATKLVIPEADYITKLEVDILVSELGLAIEYDGRYHHSLEGLKRGHPTWKLKHLKRYHSIKDAAFLKLGIRILHIKDEDWREDPQNCLRECLKFLGITETKAA